MTSVEISGDQALILKLDQQPKGIGQALVPALLVVGLGLESHLKQNELSGQALHVRTGTGRRSVFHRVETDGQDVVAVIGTDLRKAKYMRAHDKGAVIVPRQSSNLTIPIGAARTGKGVARFTAKQVINSPSSFGYVGTFVRHGVIFGAKEGRGKPVPLFALEKRVTLKAVGFLGHTLQERRAWAQDVIDKAIKGTLNQ